MNFKFAFLLVLWTFWMSLVLLTAVFSGNILISSISVVGNVATYYVGVLILYKRLVKKTRPHYPLAFPRGVDQYFPRFDIPRPMYLDLIEYPEFFSEARVAEEKAEG